MKQWILLVAIVVLAKLTFAQQLRFKHLTSEDGLSTVFVRSVIQDDKGFIWLGTQDGLNKYDGFRFKVFRKNPTSDASLPSSDIYTVRKISPSLLVVGTHDGLGFFNPVNETCLRMKKNYPELDRLITAVGLLNDSTVLAGTDEGLYTVNRNTRLMQTSLFGKEVVDVECIETINGEVYVGTSGKGLFHLAKNGTPELVKITESLPGVPAGISLSVTAVAAWQNDLLVGTTSQGVIQLSKTGKIKAYTYYSSADDLSNYIHDLAVANDKLYVSTISGVVLVDLLSGNNKQYVPSDAPFSLNSRNCFELLLDRENNCWIATELGGANIAFNRAMRFPVSTLGYEYSRQNIFSFCESSNGKLILGGVKTFLEFDPRSGEMIDHSDFMGPGTALCAARESDNVFWVGTWGNGLYRYDKLSKKATQVIDGQVGGTVLQIAFYNGFLYAGTVGDGLFKINPADNKITRFTEADGLPAPSIACMYKDTEGNLWLGTLEKGLAKMKGFDKNGRFELDKVYTNIGKPGQIISNEIRAINQDNKGHVWAATSSGLSKALPDGTCLNYYEKDGFPNTSLYSLLKDSTGSFWISSNAGIVKFNPESPSEKPELKVYGVKDGLLNTEFNMGSFYQASNGTMCFGGSSGFNLFRPSQIKNNPNAPPAYVIGYKRGGKDVSTDTLIQYKKHLDLSWRENYFQFELVALDYTDPTANKFSYKLEGYDAEWSEPSNVRYVSYTELPGGDYVFKVKAANSDGVWNDVPYEISIRVVPPFWKTKTFYALMALLLIGASVGFTQYRTRAIKKENKLLEAKVAERTKELHEKNMDIMASIHYAQRIQAALLPSRETIFSKLNKVFILYRPKDIVSGDFYWFNEKNGVKIFATVDCTGHGVPGAFMSMIGHNLLNHIVLENGITDPGSILNALHRGVQAALRQGHNEISTNDGMDVSLLTIDEKHNKMNWAGANRPLVLVSPAAEFSRLEGDKFPVGGAQAHVDRVFSTKAVEVPAGTMAYMFTDGYADQFGGEKGKKFMVKRLHELLVAIHPLPAEEQRAELEKQFLDWKATHEQVDDVLLVGIQLH